MTNRSVDVSEVLDSVPVSSYQVLVGIVCFFLMLIDGFDFAIINVAVPKVAAFLHVKPQALGAVISLGLLGSLVGAAVLGTLSDRIGRKKMIVWCALCFGVFNLLCATATSVGTFALYRFIAGLAMGGCIPTVVAFGIEYVPTRARSTFSTLMYAGVPGGGIIVGMIAAYLVPSFGWQILFIVGGGVPIVIALVAAAFLPESTSFLVRQENGQSKVRAILAKIAPALAEDKDVEYISASKKRSGVPLKHLFLEGRASITILLWICFLMGFYLGGFILAWGSTLLMKSGASIQHYGLALTMLNIGSTTATLLIGWVMDKSTSRHRVLQVGFVLAFLTLFSFGYFITSSFVVIAIVCLFNGLFLNGTTSGLVALAAVSYPTDIAGTGVGWCFSLGRCGMMLAPLVGALMIGLNWSALKICGTTACVALVIVVIVGVLASQTAKTRRAAMADAQKVAAN